MDRDKMPQFNAIRTEAIVRRWLNGAACSIPVFINDVNSGITGVPRNIIIRQFSI